jgi:hypothetical protein
MELAMFDAVVEQCQARGLRSLLGVYIPSKKNGMVADLYSRLGFLPDHEDAQGASWWRFTLPSAPLVSTRPIRRTAGPSAPESRSKAFVPNSDLVVTR